MCAKGDGANWERVTAEMHLSEVQGIRIQLTEMEREHARAKAQ